MPRDQVAETERTFYVLERCKNPIRLLSEHLKGFAAKPGAYFLALALAWQLRQPGWRAALYQLFYFAEAVVLANELKRKQIRHLHNHFGDSSCTVAMLASRLSGIPFSFTEHGPNIFFEAGRWRLDEKIAGAKFVVAISHFCRSQLMLFSHSEDWHKIDIVHCGVEPQRYRAETRPTVGKNLVYVGRVEPVKGILVLLDAMAQLKREHSDIALTIVGDGSSRKKIEKQIDRLDLSAHVRLVGYKTQEEVAFLLAKADALVLPSFAEGVPVVLMEAMASGKPVVASRVAGVQELVEDGVNGFTVPPGDVHSLAQHIGQLITDPALSAQMGMAGRKKVEQEFNTDLEAARLATLFVSGPNNAASTR